MLKHGFQEEVMLKNVLRVLEVRLLHDLKFKARIEVQKGAFLLGKTVFSTSTIVLSYLQVSLILKGQCGSSSANISNLPNRILEEGEIYCAVRKEPGDEITVIQGPCTLFRSPAVHPGTRLPSEIRSR